MEGSEYIVSQEIQALMDASGELIIEKGLLAVDRTGSPIHVVGIEPLLGSRKVTLKFGFRPELASQLGCSGVDLTLSAQRKGHTFLFVRERTDRGLHIFDLRDSPDTYLNSISYFIALMTQQGINWNTPFAQRNQGNFPGKLKIAAQIIQGLHLRQLPQ